MPALDEAEAAGAAGDLRDLPGVQVAPLLAVELLRLREEQRLAGRLTPWPSTSVAQQTVACPFMKRSISTRRDASGIAP